MRMTRRLWLRCGLLAAMLLATGCATMSRRDLPEASREPFTIVMLPDTQCYCDTRVWQSRKKWGKDLRDYFYIQTKWVKASRMELNTRFLVHAGDITQTDFDDEWQIARKAMAEIDGVVPYVLCLGNHDMGYRKTDRGHGYETAVNRSTQFNKYFPRADYASTAEFGDTFDESHDNSWYQMTAGPLAFMIISLEFNPRDEVLTWANEIVAAHPKHRVIVLTHSYLDSRGKRINRGGYKVTGNNGEQMWQKFVKKHENVFMVLCGHMLGNGRLTSKGDHGNDVHQILADYQGMKNGGESWLRYFTFHPRTNQIEAHTYNPALQKYDTTPTARFTLTYDMGGIEIPASESTERKLGYDPR
jgi:hypothetical protein